MISFSEAEKIIQSLVDKKISLVERSIGSWIVVEIGTLSSYVIPSVGRDNIIDVTRYTGEYSLYVKDYWQLTKNNKVITDSLSSNKEIDNNFKAFDPQTITDFIFDKKLDKTVIEMTGGFKLIIDKKRELTLWWLDDREKKQTLYADGHGYFRTNSYEPIQHNYEQTLKRKKLFAKSKNDPLRAFYDHEHDLLPLAETVAVNVFPNLKNFMVRDVDEEYSDAFSLELENKNDRVSLSSEGEWQLSKNNQGIISNKDKYAFLDQLHNNLNDTQIMACSLSESGTLEIIFNNENKLIIQSRWSLLHRTDGYWINSHGVGNFSYRSSSGPETEKKYPFVKDKLYLAAMVHELELLRSWIAQDKQ
jgi:hypothetical protein